MTGLIFESPDFIQSYNMGGALKVVVVGAGGTGSALLSKLFQMNATLQKLGAPALDVVVYDDDTVAMPNIGRQSFYEFDIDRPKAEVLVERFNQFGATNWVAKVERFSATSESLGYRDGGVILFGCVDNAPARKELHKAMHSFSRWGCVYVDAGNANRSGNVIVGMSAQVNGRKVVYPTVYDLYKSQLDEWKPVAGDSCSHEESIQRQDFGLNDMMAVLSSQVLWQLVRHGKCAYQMASVDFETGVMQSFQPDPDYWSMFGYVVSLN